MAAYLVLVCSLGCLQIADTDLWWRLRTGEMILERGELPATDCFTDTNPHSRWIDLHWFFFGGC